MLVCLLILTESNDRHFFCRTLKDEGRSSVQKVCSIAGVLCIIIDEFSHREELGLIVLFVIDKSLEIGIIL